MPRCGPRATRRRNTEARERSATWIYYSLATNPTREAAALTAPLPSAQKKNPACELARRPLYYVFAASAIIAGRPVSSGEVSELAEGARLEIVYAPKAYPGFKSPPLRQS